MVGLVVSMHDHLAIQRPLVIAREGAQLAFKHRIPMGGAVQVQSRKVLEGGAASFADEFPILFVDNAVLAEPCSSLKSVTNVKPVSFTSIFKRFIKNKAH